MIQKKSFIKRFELIVAAGFYCISLPAQPKEFEGVLYYQTEVKSKATGISDKDMKLLLGNTAATTVYMKKGNTRRSNGISEQYYLSSKEKIYIKFRGIDTLYYLDYSLDTSKVLHVSKTEEHTSIAGFECKTITIETTSVTSSYSYCPLLHRSPEYEKNNTIGSLNIYSKETESIWLGVHTEAELYSLTETCSRVEQKPVDESVFDLPALAQAKFTLESVQKPAEFKRGGGWEKYLQANLNFSVGAKYIKIPKGETEARQTVQLSFIISETGEVTDIKVLNKEEVHSRVAEEAVRVLKESYGWKPATIYGEKVSSMMKQGITFQVTK